MFRRQFIHRMTLTGVGGLAISGSAKAADGYKAVTYQVEGFTCVTCAVGLEVMLRRENGVARAEASYPKRSVLIEFDPALVTERALNQYIGEMGFSVKE
jgi:copper chaperone CopZ